MQSTSNTAASAPARPKIGRPPAELFLVPKEAAPEAAHPRHMKAVVAGVVLALAIALAAGRLMLFSPHAAPRPLQAATPAAPAEVGMLLPITPADPAVSYVNTARPPIDNAARARLLSILSKD